jgi:hypothetical protein
MRTASALVDCFFGAAFDVLLIVGIMGSDWAGAIERCSTGCMLMGPVTIRSRPGILDNAVPTNLFDCPNVGNARDPYHCIGRRGRRLGKLLEQFIRLPSRHRANRGVKRPNVWTPLRRRQHELKSRASSRVGVRPQTAADAMIRRLIDSPIPVPCGFVVKNASKMRSLSSADNPMPESPTEISN